MRTSIITYLDYNATAPMRKEAVRAVSDILPLPHNASSVHSLGRAAHKMVEDAREKVAALVKCPPAQVIFNSGATEGNNTVLKYFANERILISAIEHPSVLEAAPNAERIPVTPDGLLNLKALEDMLKTKKTALVSVMMVNNETGIIQPISEISTLTHRHGALLHVDAVQAAGRLAIDMPMAGIDFLTLSAHKIGGPQGVGALCLGLCGITPSLIDGGGQEKKARGGTQNTAGIHGFGIAAGLAAKNLKHNLKLEEMRTSFESKLLDISPNIVIHGQNAPRVSNTTLLSIPDVLSETLLISFDLEDIAISNGSACSSGRVGKSHVLAAMNVPDDLTFGVLRVSTGWATTKDDLNHFLDAWKKIYTRLQEKKAKKSNA